MEFQLVFSAARRAWSVLFFLAIAFHSLKGERFSRSVEDDIDSFVKDFMKCNNAVVPGLTLAVVHGQKSMLRGYGVTEPRTNNKVDPKTLFCIGSVSKSFTAVVVGKALQDSKRWNWDTPVSEIIGDGFKLSDEYRTKYITVRDILGHRTGVPDYEGGYTTGYKVDRETLSWRLQYMNATHPAHTTFMYNNHMYMLAGYVAEKITGRTWEELVQEQIFNNLGMTSTKFVGNLVQGPNVAKAVALTPDGKEVVLPVKLLRTVVPLGPAGSICSNAEDMAKYMRFQLNRSALPSGKTLLDDDIYAEMHARQMPVPPSILAYTLPAPIFPAPFNTFAYGFGWFAGTYRGYPLQMHSGGISTFTTNLWLITGQKLAIFTSFNGPAGGLMLRPVHQYITDRLLGLKPWLNGTNACQFPMKWVNDYLQAKHKNAGGAMEKRDVGNTAHARPLKQYVGTYGHLAFGDITIRLKKSDGKLHLYTGRWGHAELESTSTPDRFLMRFVDDLEYFVTNTYEIKFSSSDGKRIDQLHASYIEATAPPVFVRGLKRNEHRQSAKRSTTRKKRDLFDVDFCATQSCAEALLGYLCD